MTRSGRRGERLASLSLDLDNHWSYLKTHGDRGWTSLPSYLDLVVPRILSFLEARRLTITFFIVGLDAGQEKNHRALRQIVEAGHEIGNHSHRHEPWLHRYSEEEVEGEIAAAEEAIEGATGKRPAGFRGPGFSLSPAVLRVLARRGYRYDATTLPTFIGPLARAYYFMTARLTPEEKEARKDLFNGWRDGLRPIRPYRWNRDCGGMLEIPVTTMPIFRLPFHLSYLLYLSIVHPTLARSYFRFARALCVLGGVEPSFLLHPLDFLGKDDGLADLAFFPAMGLSSRTKITLAGEILDRLGEAFEIVPMGEHARRIEMRFEGAQGGASHPLGGKGGV